MNNALSQPAARPLGDIAVGAVQEAKDRLGSQLTSQAACAQDKARKLRSLVRDSVADKPLAALAVTLGVGLLLGAVLARR